MKKRKAWVVTYEMGDRGIFMGQVTITFLHEPTIDDVLFAMFEDPGEPGSSEAMVKKHRDRIIERRYRVRETWVWERAS